MYKPYQSQYYEIMNNIKKAPRKIGESRIGPINSRFFETLRVDVRKEFPLMDIKWLKFSNILHELLWFVKGDTNTKYLSNNGCNIWNDDAYRYYNEKYVPLGCPKLTNDEFSEKVKAREIYIYKTPKDENEECAYIYGDLDRIYGKQWRNFNGKTDQLQNCIDKLKTNPDDRRMIVSAHNPTDLEEGNVGLPSCHNFFQFYTEEISYVERMTIAKHRGCEIEDVEKRYVNIWFNIRSNDWFLGQPYNMPSYAILLMMVGKLVNMIPKELVCSAVDAHLYKEHFKPAEIWDQRYNEIVDNVLNSKEEVNTSDIYFNLLCQSKLEISDREINSIDEFTYDDFDLSNYDPQPYIKAKLLT